MILLIATESQFYQDTQGFIWWNKVETWGLRIVLSINQFLYSFLLELLYELLLWQLRYSTFTTLI